MAGCDSLYMAKHSTVGKNPSKIFPKKLKITDPSKENNINVINAVKEPFCAILIFSFSENLSVIIISTGEIPIGFIRVNRVVKQKIKNCISC